jgi:hypothetical protein
MGTGTITLNSVLESVACLDLEDQQYLQDVIRRRLVEAKRTALAKRAAEARTAAKKKRTRSGTAHDLLADLND